MPNSVCAGDARDAVGLFEILWRTHLLDDFQGVPHANYLNVGCFRFNESAELLRVALKVEFKTKVLFSC